MALPYRVLIPLFPLFNTLDVNGPVEILCNAAFDSVEPKPFSVTIAAAQPTTQAYETVTMQRNIDFIDALEAVERGEYDVLIVPGAGQAAIMAVINSGGDGLLDLISAFINRPSPDKERWLISICTGAEIVGSVGGFVGMTATTHWGALGALDQICAAYIAKNGGAPTKVVRERFVDGKENVNGIHVASAGGISCGLDCVLWLMSKKVSLQTAVDVATTMDYVWNYSHGTLPPTRGPPPTAWTTVQSTL